MFLHFSEDAARAEGLTPMQHQLLLSVRGHPGDELPVIGDLAEALQLRHHSAVELVDRAERARLVVRRTDRADHRKQRIDLTAKGRRVLERLSAIHRDELQRFGVELADHLADLA